MRLTSVGVAIALGAGLGACGTGTAVTSTPAPTATSTPSPVATPSGLNSAVNSRGHFTVHYDPTWSVFICTDDQPRVDLNLVLLYPDGKGTNQPCPQEFNAPAFFRVEYVSPGDPDPLQDVGGECSTLASTTPFAAGAVSGTKRTYTPVSSARCVGGQFPPGPIIFYTFTTHGRSYYVEDSESPGAPYAAAVATMVGNLEFSD